MSRRPKISYEKTPFCKRIVELQKQHNYTDQYIIDNVKDSHGIPVAGSLQVYATWKLGSRLPANLQEAILAFARFYDVSTDYLLKEDEPEKPIIGNIEEVTGLDPVAIRNLISFNDQYPDIIKMLSALLSFTDEKGILLWINFYHQLLKDYEHSKDNNREQLYNIEEMRLRIISTERLYNIIRDIVFEKLSDHFDAQIEIAHEYDNAPID